MNNLVSNYMGFEGRLNRQRWWISAIILAVVAIIISLVILHVLAILYYRVVKKHNLVRPMVLGDKEVGHPAASSRDDAASRTVAVVLVAACAGAVWWLVRLGTAQ